MDQPKDFDEPDDLPPPEVKFAGGSSNSSTMVPPPTRYARLPAVEAELVVWYGLSEDQKRTLFTNVVNGRASLHIETLIHVTRLAWQMGDQKAVNLAFSAVSKVATPLLLSQAKGLLPHERQDQAQEILLQLFKAIIEGKADYAEARFASFAQKRAISCHRTRQRRFEGANQKTEATDTIDPVDNLPAKIPSSEARALLSKALDTLPLKHRAAFTQYHYFRMTQEEIAAHHNVRVRTIQNWLEAASTKLGLAGDPK